MNNKYKEHINQFISFIDKKRMIDYSNVMNKMSANNTLHSSNSIYQLSEAAKNNFDIMLDQWWIITRDSLEVLNIENAYKYIEDTLFSTLFEYINSQKSKVFDEIKGRADNLFGSNPETDKLLKRIEVDINEYCEVKKNEYERLILKYKSDLHKSIQDYNLSNNVKNESILQAKSSKKSVYVAWSMFAVALISLIISAINILTVRKTTKLTSDYVESTKKIVDLSQKQYSLLNEQWEVEKSPNIIADYDLLWFDSGNTMVKIYIKNIGKGIANKLTYFIDATGTKGEIQFLYKDQEYSLLIGNVHKYKDKMREGFTINIQYYWGKERKEQQYTFKLNYEKDRRRDIRDIYYILDKLHKEFESIGSNTRYNISGKLYSIKESLEKIEKKIK